MADEKEAQLAPDFSNMIVPQHELNRQWAEKQAKEQYFKEQAEKEKVAIKQQQLEALMEKMKTDKRIDDFINNRPRPSTNPYDASYTQGETKLSTGSWSGPDQRIAENLNRTPGAGPRQRIEEGQVPAGSTRHERNFAEGMSPQELEKFRREHGIMPR